MPPFPSARKQSVKQASNLYGPPFGAAGNLPFSPINSDPVSQQASKLRVLHLLQTLKPRGSNT